MRCAPCEYGITCQDKHGAPIKHIFSWWNHQMETFSTLLALCEGNPPVSGWFPSQRPVTQSIDVFFPLHPNKRLSKQSRRRLLEILLRSLWCHCNASITSSLCHFPAAVWDGITYPFLNFNGATHFPFSRKHQEAPNWLISRYMHTFIYSIRYACDFVMMCFVVVLLSILIGVPRVPFTYIPQGCFTGNGAMTVDA